MAIQLAEIFEKSRSEMLTPAMAAILLGADDNQLKNRDLWPVVESDEAKDFEFSFKELVSMEGGRQDLLSCCARDISASVQFPVSTAFMHGLGCVATAMMPFFRYRYHSDDVNVGIYIVTSQPPGSGKSAVNNYFSKPVSVNYERISDEHRKQRAKINAKVSELKSQLKDASNANEIIALNEDLGRCYGKMKELPLWKYTWTDITPEALEYNCGQQNGYFNLVSDEATVINSLMGDMYSDRPKNNEVMLKGWDGGDVSTARIGREGYSGRVMGTVAVCAQDETIQAIMKAGERGNGLCQRFLIYREPTYMGSRNYDAYRPRNEDVYAEYHKMIFNITSETDVSLSFSNEAIGFIRAVQQKYEPTLRDGGENSQDMIRGVISKAEKQLMKLASILHVVEQWKDGAARSRTVGIESVTWAYSIYECLVESYINSASSQGVMGKNIEIEKVCEIMTNHARKGKLSVSVQALKDSIKGRNPFKGHQKLISHLRTNVLPAVQEKGYICVSGSTIYINPRLRG